MLEVRFAPEVAPSLRSARGAPLVSRLAALVTRSAAMGVLSGAPVTHLDARTVARLVGALQRVGVGHDAGIALAPLTQDGVTEIDPQAARRAEAGLDRLDDALEASAVPELEWPAMRAIFDDEALVTLLDIAPSSLRRYASGERATPDEVAARLHWVALVVGDLAGSYNAFGIRRWFVRPRAQLDGKSPRELLGAAWSPDGEAAARVRALSRALVGPLPLDA